MAVTEIVLLIVTAVTAAVYFWCKHNFSYWRRQGIPYVEPTPLVGNMKCVFTLKNSFGLHLSDIYKDPSVSHAPVVGIYALNKPALVIREPELLKSVLIKDFSKFVNRSASADPHEDALGYNNLFFVNNPEWKDIRNKLTPVFTSGKIKQMYPLMLEIGAELETHLASYPKTGNKFITEVKEICGLFTTDLIATIAFGVRANSLQNPKSEFCEQGRKFFHFNLARGLEAFVAFFLPKLTTLFRVKIFSKEFSKFLRDTIDYVMSERERSGKARNDLIDVLLTLKKDATHDFAKNNDFLVAQAAAFLTAGFETSSSTMAFALYELAKHPELQKRLRAEICGALLAGKGSISYETINSLEYLGMVLDEVLRLYPVLPFLDRQYNRTQNEAAFSLKPYYDYELPDEMPIYVPIYGLQTDPKYWPNPMSFDPERFSNENKQHHLPMTYMPFGTGPRNCIGSRIGLLQAKIGLVHIFKNHAVETCDRTVSEIQFEPKALVLQCVGGINLNIVNDCLYENEALKTTSSQ